MLVGSPSELTEGHIVPASAGGKVVAALCKRCNETFGQTRDIVFSNALAMVADPLGLKPGSKLNARRLTVNGLEVGGTARELEDGSLEFLIHDPTSNPESLRKVLGLFSRRSGRVLGATDFLPKELRARMEAPTAPISVSFKRPPLPDEKVLRLAVLTAGYLLWFRALGYSWVLQAHLQGVREALCAGTGLQESGALVGAWKDNRNRDLWLGLGRVLGSVFPVAGVARWIAIFPAANERSVASLAAADESELEVIQEFPLSFRWTNPVPVSVGIDRHFVVMPDQCLRGRMDGRVIYFPHPHSAPDLLYTVTEEQARLAKGRPETRTFRGVGQFEIADQETKAKV